MKKKGQKKYSYIRLPYSRSGWYSFVLGLVVSVITAVIMVIAVRTSGEVPSVMAAAGVSAILLGIMGVVFALLSLLEKEHNHIFAFIGGVLSALTLTAWGVITLL
ncbi:MAG: hypothetical protein IKE56_06850 [Lachnospiraceae bacterium]|nr:hypothetical protein [Lachnospiraceae bacterium]MBR2532364.1 hypothetical protein [Lachnospiraceae bacterium]